MIKCNNGGVHLDGEFSQLFIDLVAILHAFIEMMGNTLGRAEAEKIVALAGRFAVLDEAELAAKFNDIIEEFRNDPRV